MAATEDNNDTTTKARNTRFGNAVTGDLGEDFLRIDNGQSVQNNTNNMANVAYNSMYGGFHQSGGGALSITVVQATLAKNYGLTRMDPYCRLRIGTQIFETTTAYNGAKTPRWNKIIHSQVPETLREFYVEIFDECSFQVDERIAHGNVILKDELFQGETIEDWFCLSGKQGEGKEGMIHLVLQYRQMNIPHPQPVQMVQNPMMVVNPMGGAVYGYSPYQPAVSMIQPQFPAMVPPQRQVQPNVNNRQVTPEIKESDLQTLKEMCPGMDVDIIKSVLQQSSGNIDRAASVLLEMSAE